jgi:hypothetical protein
MAAGDLGQGLVAGVEGGAIRIERWLKGVEAGKQRGADGPQGVAWL